MNAAWLALSAALLAAPACNPQKVAKKARLGFPDGKTIQVDVVDDPRTREIGLMCRTGLPKDYGMLFVFPGESQFTFWMKNTLVSLDMVWIGADKRITALRERMKESTVDTPDFAVARASGEGQYVLELPAGAAARHHLKPGDKLSFKTPVPAS